MDGLAEDADVIFLLTTNRPDLLEPALAARPGRIDQAIEVPRRTPTAAAGCSSGSPGGCVGRRDWDRLVARTAG